MKKLTLEEIKIKIGADWIYDDGRFVIKDKWGIVNLKTGKIIKEAFAGFIWDDGTFLNGFEAIRKIDMKTGKIIEEAK